jgi:hypothetical protein|tara:strand:+ start:25059 stop:26903 length:1845 start_codon:yes stop_codon:yes gene_type:complete
MAENVQITISALDKTKQAFGGLQATLNKVGGSLASLSKKAALMGVAVTAAFTAITVSSLRSTDSLSKTAAKIGTTTEALGALRYAADLTGVSTTTMDMALQRFTRRTAEAAQGMGEAKGAIQELGINAQELNKMPLDERMIVLADAFSNVESESDRLRLAFKLFDSEGAALVNTLSQGSEGLKGMLGEARSLGLAMSTGAAQGVEDTVDSLTKLQSLFKGITNQTVAAFAPAIEMIVERFTGFLQRSIEAKGGIEAFARTLAVDLLGGVKIALQGFEDLANGFIKVYNTALTMKDGLTNAFTSDNEKNARQLRVEVEKLEEEMARRAQRMSGYSDAAKARLAITQASDQKRLETLRALMAQAEETGDALNLMDEVSFAGGLNSQIQTVIDSLGKIPSGITEAVVPALEKISDLEVGFNSWSQLIPDLNIQIQDLTKQGLDGMTNALTAGITGAASFADAMRSMSKSVVDSLIKMLVQKYIVDAAFGLITGASGGGNNTGSTGLVGGGVSGNSSFNARGYAAIGGPVEAGSPYVVGERGPEMFVPNQKGAIIPNNKMGGGGGVVVNQTINVSTGVQQTVRAEIATLMPQIANAAKGAVVDARMRGGGYSKALVGA